MQSRVLKREFSQTSTLPSPHHIDGQVQTTLCVAQTEVVGACRILSLGHKERNI